MTQIGGEVPERGNDSDRRGGPNVAEMQTNRKPVACREGSGPEEEEQ